MGNKIKKEIPDSNSGMLLRIVVLVGDQIKTDLRERYFGEGFSPGYRRTIGADFALVDRKILNRNIRFQIWDLEDPTQDRFGEKQKAYPEGVLGAIIVINAEKPFIITDVEKQIKHIQVGTGNKEIPIIVACIHDNSSKKPKKCYSSDDIQIIIRGRESLNSSNSQSHIRYFHVDLNNSQEVYSLLDTLGTMYLLRIS